MITEHEPQFCAQCRLARARRYRAARVARFARERRDLHSLVGTLMHRLDTRPDPLGREAEAVLRAVGTVR